MSVEDLHNSLALIHSLANDTTADNWGDKRLYVLQTCVRMSDTIAALEAQLAEVVQATENCCALLEMMAENAMKRDDTIEWSMMSVMAERSRRILSALEATPPAPKVNGEPDFAASIEAVIAEESNNGAAAGWRSCTGCHETNEGYETGRYPFSKMFGCHVGSGCIECGGLGVVWVYWDEGSLQAMSEDDAPPAPKVTEAELPQDVIDLVIAARDYWDANDDLSPESRALDKALEEFTSRVPYADAPQTVIRTQSRAALQEVQE